MNDIESNYGHRFKLKLEFLSNEFACKCYTKINVYFFILFYLPWLHVLEEKKEREYLRDSSFFPTYFLLIAKKTSKRRITLIYFVFLLYIHYK
jgi:hypothetical protein